MQVATYCMLYEPRLFGCSIVIMIFCPLHIAPSICEKSSITVIVTLPPQERMAGVGCGAGVGVGEGKIDVLINPVPGIPVMPTCLSVASGGVAFAPCRKTHFDRSLCWRFRALFDDDVPTTGVEDPEDEADGMATEAVTEVALMTGTMGAGRGRSSVHLQAKVRW